MTNTEAIIYAIETSQTIKEEKHDELIKYLLDLERRYINLLELIREKEKNDKDEQSTIIICKEES